jgi:hypothetical protein
MEAIKSNSVSKALKSKLFRQISTQKELILSRRKAPKSPKSKRNRKNKKKLQLLSKKLSKIR